MEECYHFTIIFDDLSILRRKDNDLKQNVPDLCKKALFDGKNANIENLQEQTSNYFNAVIF